MSETLKITKDDLISSCPYSPWFLRRFGHTNYPSGASSPVVRSRSMSKDAVGILMSLPTLSTVVGHARVRTSW